MNAETGFSLRNFILKVILVILFVFLLMWLIPMPNMKPIYDRLFAENVETMKEAAKAYYTVERLPKEVGQTVKMTLTEMLAEKLVLPIVDSKGNVCNGDASYVSVTKTDTEYVIKTSLTCGSQTDYILEHMGCYNICNDTCKVAEEQKPQIKTRVIYKDKVIIKDPEKPTPPPEQPQYRYTYGKYITTPVYGPWSNWSSDTKYVDSDHIAFGCTETSCTEVSPNSPRREIVGTHIVYKTDAYGQTIPIFKTVYDRLLGSYSVYGCNAYDYVIYENSGIYKYTVGSAQRVYVGQVELSYQPTPGPNEEYEFLGTKYDDGCTADSECRARLLVYNKYVYNYTKISSSTTPNYTIDVSCSDLTAKTVNVYGKRKIIVDYEIEKKEPAYGYVKYYRTKSRTKTYKTVYDKQTRDHEDQDLINKGYTLISKVRIN